jgi:hypothetical protein
MNERIRELYEQARLQAKSIDADLDRQGWMDLYHQKFAELIVRECYETIKKDMELAHIQLIPIDFGIYANGRLRRIIKEHFGVEE